MPVLELAGWATIIATVASGIAYLSHQIDAKLSTDKYEKLHRELEERVRLLERDLAERIRKMELWASKKSYNGN